MTEDNTTPEMSDESSAVTESDRDSSKNSDKRPTLEVRDGKYYIDGVRVYSRDDTNKIAANAAREHEQRLLNDLKVDNLDQVRKVVNQLQDSQDLNVDTLRDAVRKREQSIEELRAELQRVKTESVLKEHLTQLQAVMPATWNSEQKAAVLDLMKSRNMLVMENETFAIRNGDSYFTDDTGSNPDYQAAVQLMGKTLGLPMAKQGVSTISSDRVPQEPQKNQPVDQKRLADDTAYRAAYVQIRDRNRSLTHAQITDAMIKQQMEQGSRVAPTNARLLTAGASTKQTKARR